MPQKRENNLEATVLQQKMTTEYVPQTDRSTLTYVVEDVAVGGSAWYRFWKRLFDLVVSILAGVVLLVPMLIIGVMIRLDSAGPAIYRQERLGKNGKPFVLYKFRSMHQNAEQNGPQWAKVRDQRCTRLGKILRASRVDELPQLWNIFKGEMSFVGPRPERSCFYEEFETYIHGFSKRMQVRPGLTGLAQINGGYDLKPEEKIVYDMQYIKNRSLKLDLKCIFGTTKLVFTHKGAR